MKPLVLGTLCMPFAVACSVDPYCLDCVDAESDGADASSPGDAPFDRIDPEGGDGCATNLEVCDLLDNDCDGQVDEGELPEVGEPCGTDEGGCVIGEFECMDGLLVCGGQGVLSAPESCNGLDDDCDGAIDNGDPGGGIPCGNDVGECEPGITLCDGGDLTCVDEIPAAAEECDGRDNDCDENIDEGNPGGGGSCDSGAGGCALGALRCAGGEVRCVGGGDATSEVCDDIDNDCDGTIDEGFDFEFDARHCGGCDVSCARSHAVGECDDSVCQIDACDSGYHDFDGDIENGCEYACEINGAEVCNGVDDDCDMLTDEGLVVPPLCAAAGACAGTAAQCEESGGTVGWGCTYGADVSIDDEGEIVPESTCDGIDNDCDGVADEPFPLKGTDCSQGVGECRTTGTYGCSADGTTVECGAAAPGSPITEACDDRDNDCDGSVDEELPLSAITTVVVNRPGGGTMRVMAYEASRPDATSSSAGSTSTVACSRGGVVPWASVSWTEARDACCALNAMGACPADGATGWRLCSSEEWETACRSPSGACTWAYGSNCAESQRTLCNGKEYDCGTDAGDQDCLVAAGAATFSSCYANWGAAGRVFDLAGNLREWTRTPASSGYYETRGGSYNSIEAGRSCDFDFAIGDASSPYPNTGFRCCYY